MKVVVFGASGGTGRHIVDQALEAGYEVTAFVRSPEKLGIEYGNLTVFQGDVMDAESVERAIADQDAVLSALGPTRPPVSDMMVNAATNIVAAMDKHGVRRIVSTTGGGVRDPQDQPKFFDHTSSAPVIWIGRSCASRDWRMASTQVCIASVMWVRIPVQNFHVGMGLILS
jgi:putative NADH-flavin reductase